MPRLARVIVPGLPHHVTQRGNRGQPIFVAEGDHALYRDLLAERCRKASVDVWAYCLMPNHVHLIMVPHSPDGLARAIGETHRQYTAFINARARWSGHLFQGRFSSVVLDEEHLLLAARYVALNPVRAGLVARPQDWAWSSVPAHLAGRDDGLVRVAPLVARSLDALIDGEPNAGAFARLRAAESTGRPLGSDAFVGSLEALLRRPLLRQKPGRKPKAGPGIGDDVNCQRNNQSRTHNSKRDADELGIM
jgi:putative transposase